MYELKITANTVEELLAKAAALAAMGASKPVTPEADVPLPEPRFTAEPEPKRRGRKPKDPEAEQHMHAAAEPVQESPETEHVEADVSEKASEPNTSGIPVREVDAIAPSQGWVTEAHAAPGEIYLLAGDKPNAEGRQLTYIDGQRHSSVMNPEVSKLKTYAQHAPEKPSEDDIPEHMRDENGLRSLTDLVEGVEPLKEGEEVPEDVMRPTETATAPPAEPEPATSATATPASDDGAPPEEDSGRSMPEGDAELPSDFAAYIDTVEAAETWDQVKVAMREFFGSDTFKGFTPDQQNKVRANTAEECFAHVKDLPDHAEDITMFRIWIEAADDLDAIVGTKRVLEQSDQWKAVSDATRVAINNAVDVRLAAFR